MKVYISSLPKKKSLHFWSLTISQTTSDNKKRSNCRRIGAGPAASMRFAFSYPLLGPGVGEGKKVIASPDVHNIIPLLTLERISQFLE